MLDFRLQQAQVNVRVTGKNLDSSHDSCQETSTNHVFLRARVAAFDAAIRTPEHSTLLATPDSDLTTIWAGKLDRAFSGEYGARAPRTGGHAYDFLTCDGGRCAQAFTLRVSDTHTADGYKLIAKWGNVKMTVDELDFPDCKKSVDE